MYKEIFLGNTLTKDRRNVHMETKKNGSLNVLSWGMVIIGVCIMVLIGRENRQRVDFQKDIAKEIIRFHVIANSDTDQDQKLKLKVKEKIVANLQASLKSANSIVEARKIIQKELSNVEYIANKVIIKEGYHYSSKAKLIKCNFPIKEYGDMVFPAGEYEALRVELGEAQGKNWWCVMFPTLCFIKGTYGIVPEESKEELQTVLTEEEYNSLLVEKKETVGIRFKVVDLWKTLWS